MNINYLNDFASLKCSHRLVRILVKIKLTNLDCFIIMFLNSAQVGVELCWNEAANQIELCPYTF